eukprot:g3698.t1
MYDSDVMDMDIDVENQYYNSKGILAEGDDLVQARQGFESVLEMEETEGEWGFKALKQIIKIHFQLGEYNEMLNAYQKMLNYVEKNVVNRNQSEKKINSLMEYLSQFKNVEILQQFYETTLKALEGNHNDRLWFKTNLKLCSLHFSKRDFNALANIIKELKKSCTNEDGSSDVKKGTQLLEVYAVEIQMYTEQKNNKKLKELYHDALQVKSAIPHPRIMGIIRECGGKMHMADEKWSKAATDFFEAFKSYDEAGASRRIQCLKYLVLATMLMESIVDPLTAQESQSYKNDPEVKAMTDLVDAYQRNDINGFEKILKNERSTIMGDPFIQQYIQELLVNVRTQVLMKIIKPYTRVTTSFVSRKLNIPLEDVQQLLVSLILDKRILGTIDQVHGVLELEQEISKRNQHDPLNDFIKKLESLQGTVLHRLQW